MATPTHVTPRGSIPRGVAGAFFGGLRRFAQLAPEGLDGLRLRPAVVYGGDERQTRSGVEVVPWRELGSLLDP